MMSQTKRTGLVGFCKAFLMLTMFLQVPVILRARASEHREPPSHPEPDGRLAVEALGLRSPGSLYKLSGRSSTTLNFADEENLVLSFRQPRLLARERGHREDTGQLIRAFAIELSSGRVLSCADWTMYDHERYLWPLPGGNFLIRQGDSYFLTDKSLRLREFLTVPTPVYATQVSPDGSTLVIEHEFERHTPEEHRRLTALALKFGDPPPKEDTQVSIVDISTRRLVRSFRIESPVRIPISRDGYVGVSSSKDDKFSLQFVPFQGPSEKLGEISSICPPRETFVNREALLIESCGPKSSDAYLDMWTSGAKKLWNGKREGHLVLPTFAFSSSGKQFAVGLLRISHTLEPGESLEDEAVRAQVVQVFDTATGNLQLETSASPVLAAGQNFALSPRGDRLAVLRDGAIEIFRLPSVEE